MKTNTLAIFTIIMSAITFSAPSFAADPCKVLICMYGKETGDSGNCRSLGPPGMGWAVLVGSQPMNETDWGVQRDTPERQNLMAESWTICQ